MDSALPYTLPTYDAPPRVRGRGQQVRSWVLLAVGLAGLALCCTTLFTGMREVMGVGGACAEGGPYQVAVPCPDGVEVLVAPALPLGFVFAGMVAFGGAGLASGAAGLAFLAWPVLFLSLGWNFLEFGLDPAGGGGEDWGLLTCAAVFALLGGAPLAALPSGWRALGRRQVVVPVALAAAAAGLAGGLLLTAAVTGG